MKKIIQKFFFFFFFRGEKTNPEEGKAEKVVVRYIHYFTILLYNPKIMCVEKNTM